MGDRARRAFPAQLRADLVCWRTPQHIRFIVLCCLPETPLRRPSFRALIRLEPKRTTKHVKHVELNSYVPWSKTLCYGHHTLNQTQLSRSSKRLTMAHEHNMWPCFQRGHGNTVSFVRDWVPSISSQQTEVAEFCMKPPANMVSPNLRGG